VDARGKPVAPGNSGEIVISNLTNRATVLLNYKLGDRVTLDRAPCPCGRTLPTIVRLDGRADELIVQPDGKMIYLSVITERFADILGIIQTQLIQEEARRFSLRVVCAPQTDWEQTRPRLDAALRAVLGNDIVTTIQRVEMIAPAPGGKVSAFISRCAG
jgi:phenylacetate-CoA ligase